MAVSPSLIAEAIRWRRDFHACPELGYQEQETSRRIAELLTSFGLQVHSGLAGTGVVATLENGPGPVIGLRADMDALPITEQGDVSYKSRNPGVMHACGHDGHSAMLLATAAHLAQTRRFRGTVHFVFQPAEENLGGARKMVEEGLFERFPMDAIYALHNWPGMPLGQVAINSGAMMASLDAFEITLTGKSCHAAMPERGADPIVAAAQLIMALQTIPSRRLSPQESTVVSITQIVGGEAINVLPDKVVLRGTFRCLNNQVRERVRGLIESYVAAQPQVSDVEGNISWYPGYPVTTNDPVEAQKVCDVATALLGESAVSWNGNPSMASEDFACMLEACPGAYFWIGTDGETASKPLHNAGYDFNDELIPHGVTLWTALVEKLLA
ncbi:amidohydrolase [Klebsiella huaxiensis]|uniref:M20 family metallopeptidase n=1 Tax=Klebsiella huaxiensis TaxID=2153354 RepID=A0ABT6EHS1_9ENTR|nr:M20 aminoacylase family protein [Klebsiella huaxiensis]MDG1643800.1 M20 family metallopeptidase [Klebsiella huaxiensis]QBG07906.1 amidohydrolase [Klebsiella huaxiensis]VUT15260.1 putative hydrolase YxeP [Klebsiella huaxiensis]